MLRQIPVITDNRNYEFRISLDGVFFTLAFRLNFRMNRWFMDVKDAEDIPLINGVPLLQGSDLIVRFKDAALPAGHFIIFNLENEAVEAGADDLGVNSLLLYADTT